MCDKYKNEHRDWLRHGFPIPKEAREEISNWMTEHETTHKDHDDSTCSRFTYSFVPSSDGIVGIVSCMCGEKFKLNIYC